MKTYRTIAGVIPVITWIVFLLSVEAPAQVKPIEDGWKGIRVFETSRGEVEKILGSPIDRIGELYTIYSDSEARIVVHYYSSECCMGAGSNKGRYRLEKDTVIDYQVFLKKPISLTDLKWKKELYGHSPSTEFPRVHVYATDGLWITTEKVGTTEMAHNFWFLSTEGQQTRFRCLDNQ